MSENKDGLKLPEEIEVEAVDLKAMAGEAEAKPEKAAKKPKAPAAEKAAEEKPKKTRKQAAPADEAPAKAKPAGKKAAKKPEPENKEADKPEKPEPPAEKAEKNTEFQEKVWKPFLWPIAALVAICLVTSLLLGLTNQLTEPMIVANAAAAAADARRALLPEADDFTQESTDGLPDNVTAIYSANNGAGWVVESWGRGYGGQVPAMVAFAADGTIAGVTFLENSETPGLGANVSTKPEFAAQFSGRGAESISLGDVDKIASATITTGAAVNAVNAAVEAYNIRVKGAAEASSPEEIRAGLLPGESLTQLSLDAPNVLDAWRGDAGNYIITAQAPSGNENNPPLTAMVAMTGDGVILDLWIDSSGESEQYGATLATNHQFLDSFIGHSQPVVVDVVADISNSSRSVMEAVNNALTALPLAKEAE